MSGPNLRDSVLAAKQALQEYRATLQAEHAAGLSGTDLCLRWAERLDAIIVATFRLILADLDPSGTHFAERVALVAHGGLGRRDTAPYSDVDLMLLIHPGVDGTIKPAAGRLLRDVGDLGLSVGQSVRTVKEACSLGSQDPVICTSLIESRLLAGSETLFDQFRSRFRSAVSRRSSSVFAAVEQARADERGKFGDTVFLLEPNLKRSRGGLRDYQLLRWVGFLNHGVSDLRALRRLKAISGNDLKALEAAHEYLLRLRNELHFHAGRGQDVLDRMEQFRIAAKWMPPAPGPLLPVERFMQEYFRHTHAISHRVTHFVEGARPGTWRRDLSMLVLSHRLAGEVLVGPVDVRFSRRGLLEYTSDLGAVMRLADHANAYDKPIEYRTSEAIRRNAPRMAPQVTPEAARHFLSLLNHPGRLANVLRNLHAMGVLEKVIPDYGRIRGLLSFSEDHRYTIDEHSILAVEIAVRWMSAFTPYAKIYKESPKKWLLHLALLLHDVGKGLDEDHSAAGARAAADTAERLGLSGEDTQLLLFLVEKHLRLADVAFRRDLTDPAMILQVAQEMGSPEKLRLLYLLTIADMTAVAPGVWNAWKEQVLADLYERVMERLSGEAGTSRVEARLQRIRDAVKAALKPLDEDWEIEHLGSLPAVYLQSAPPERIAEELRHLKRLPPDGIWADARPMPETESLQISLASRESVTPGMFHKVAGALTCKNLEILSAEICTLPDGLVLDHFLVRDGDYPFPPPPERLQEVAVAVRTALGRSGPPPLERSRRFGRNDPIRHDGMPGPKVVIDNTTSERCTIIDVFAGDRFGLLYAIARTMFELGLSVVMAKITTALDQVADVFYVHDEKGRKIKDVNRLREIRLRLETRIEDFERLSLSEWHADEPIRGR